MFRFSDTDVEIKGGNAPLSPTNFQIYKNWPSPVFCLSKSMVYWSYKINKTKKYFCQIFILWILEVCDVCEKRPKNKIEKLLNETV